MDLSSITNLELRSGLIVSAGAIGLLWYYICLCDMGFHPTPQGQTATGFRQFQSLSITTISVSLATYVGYAIGLPSVQSVTDNANKIADAAVAAVPAASAASAAQAAASAVSASIPTVSALQVGSAAMYVVSLLVAVGFYWKSKDETEPAVTGLAKSLLGFVAGVFSIALNDTL